MSREGGWSRTRSSCALGPTGASGSGPAAPNRLTKGRVERPVSSIRKNFFYGRDFGSDEELSARMLRWLGTEANVRVHGTLKERPVDRLDRESLHLSDSLTRQQRKRRQTAAWIPDLPLGTSKATNPKGDRNVHGRTVWRRCHRCIGRLRRAGYVDGSEGILPSPHGRVTFPLTLLQGDLPECRGQLTRVQEQDNGRFRGRGSPGSSRAGSPATPNPGRTDRNDTEAGERRVLRTPRRRPAVQSAVPLVA